MANNHHTILRSYEIYHKGQRVFYKGDTAVILDVKPVFTIKIECDSTIICGDALVGDVRPSEKSEIQGRFIEGG